MARVKRGVTARARHKKVLKLAKGYRGRAHNAFRVALEKVEKGLRYAYRDRRAKKRNFRALWIQRINAGVRAEGLTYGQFMHGVKRAGIALDRKVLADLAVREPEAFKAIVAQAQAALGPAVSP
jgi:large subunit ribosomal protein L20